MVKTSDCESKGLSFDQHGQYCGAFTFKDTQKSHASDTKANIIEQL